MEPLIAINICLVSPAFDAAAVPLSWTLAPAEPYRLLGLEEKVPPRGHGHPHCTLAQLCMHHEDIDKVRETVRHIWNTVKEEEIIQDKDTLCLSGLEEGPAFTTTSDGVKLHLSNIKINPSNALCTLHKKIVEGVKSYHVPPPNIVIGKAAFHPSFPTEGETSVNWMNDFLTHYALESYNPHITLGALPEKAITEALFKPIHIPWRECRVVVSRMGNFCSCFEIFE